MVLWKLDSDMNKNEPGPLSYIIHKDKLKMDERPKCETGNHQNSIGENSQQPLWSQPQQFLAWHMSKGKGIKSKNELWDLIKLKSFCTAKETINKKKRQPTEWEKIFANDILDKGLVSKICKEFTKLNTWKTNNLVKKWAEDMNRHFFQRRHPHGLQTHEKMLNITRHQGNTNQNHDEIPLHTCQNG